MPPRNGYRGRYRGDPSGRANAIATRQRDVQSQVDSFSSFPKTPSQDQMRSRTFSAPPPVPKTPVQKAYNEIRTRNPTIVKRTTRTPITPRVQRTTNTDIGSREITKPSIVTDNPTGRDVDTQVDTFQEFNPSESGRVGDTIRNAITGTTTVGWNLHKKYSESVENDPTLTAAQKDQKKAANLITMGGMNPLMAAFMAFPYQGLSEVSSSIKKGWGEEGRGLLKDPTKLAGVIGRGEWDAASAGWNNLLGVGQGVSQIAGTKNPWGQLLAWLGG